MLADILVVDCLFQFPLILFVPTISLDLVVDKVPKVSKLSRVLEVIAEGVDVWEVAVGRMHRVGRMVGKAPTEINGQSPRAGG